MAYSKEVVDFCKKQYFKLNDRGKRKYTYSEIVDATKEYFKDAPAEIVGSDISKLSEVTVINWATKKPDLMGNTWDAILKQTLGMKQQKAVEELQIVMDNQELAEQLTDVPKFRYGTAVAAMLKGWAYIMSEPIDSMRDAQWLVEFGAREVELLAQLVDPPKQSEGELAIAKVMKHARDKAALPSTELQEGRTAKEQEV